MNPPHDEQWWSSYFDEDFYQAYRPLLPPEAAVEAVAAIVELGDLGPGDRVLDLACGWGRHAVELGAAGLEVFALDSSAILLDRARRSPGGDRVTWIRGDQRDLPFRGSLDAVVSLFSSIGYFESDEDDRRVLLEARAALRPEGVFVLETMHRDAVVREYVERDWWRREDGAPVFVERRFDPIDGRTLEWLRWTRADGSEAEKFHSARVRSATEWIHLLEGCGLEVLGCYGDWSAEPFDIDSESLILLARPAG